jgi:hypothetical protein
MIWGCVTATGLSRFAFVSGTMDEEQYVQILQDNLLDLLDDLPLNVRPNAVFQQDNAPVHTTVRVAAFFGENDVAVAICEAAPGDCGGVGYARACRSVCGASE